MISQLRTELLYYVIPVAAVVIAAAVVVAALARRKRLASSPAAEDLPAETVSEEPAQAAGEELGLELETRANKLRQLLAEVDQRIEELRRLSSQTLSASGLAHSALERQQAEVFRLSRQGLDGVEIARRLELDVGEVELMLNLHRCRLTNKES